MQIVVNKSWNTDDRPSAQWTSSSSPLPFLTLSLLHVFTAGAWDQGWDLWDSYNDLICLLWGVWRKVDSFYVLCSERTPWRLKLPSPQLISLRKSHFPIPGWCNVLSSVISQGLFHSGGGENRHAYCLPFRNPHFSRINSASHSMAGRVHCLYGGGGV